MIKKGKGIREKEILDYHQYNIENKKEKDKKKRKKIINNIVKNQQRLHAFHYLTKYTGKRVRGCLKKLIVKDEQGNESTFLDRESIEKHIMEYNQQFFATPTETKVFKDKIYNKSSISEMRNKILDRNLNQSEYDDEDIFAFLKLLQESRGIMNSYPDYISEEMFVSAVKQSKK